MLIAKIAVNGVHATSTKLGTLTSGMVGAKVQFTFNSCWDGLSKTAVFRCMDITKDVLNIDSEVTIPHEVLASSGSALEVGVYGTNADGDLVIPARWATVGIVYSGADPSGDPSTDPSPEVWEQLQAQINALKEQGADADAIKNAVDAYMAANPLVESDPTVPAWAKQPTKPKYTAKEVGAVSTVNGTAPDENGNVEIDVSGGNVAYDKAQELTNEQKAQARENIGAQPVGNYLTEVPEGYAKTEDVPTDEEIIQLIKDNAPEPVGGIDLGVTGATVGQTVKISAVDENGVPTAWEPVEFPSGDSSRKVSLPLNEEGAPDYGTVGYYAVSDGAGGITWVAAGNTGGSGDSGETTYGIVWDLVNVTSSNSVASVKDGASLSAVLTPADGYTLGDVIVTMGGEVVTGVWNADTATVTIATVTGDVVISCAGVRVETVHLPFLGYTQDAMKAEYTYHEWVEKILTGSLQYAWFGGAINGAGTFYVEWPEDAFELVDKNGTETTGFPKGLLVLYDADGNFLSGLSSDGTLLFENGIWSETAFAYLNMKGTASFSVTVDNTDAKYLLFTMRCNTTHPDGYAETNAGFATWASENANVTFTSGAATAVEESVAQAVDAEYQQNYEVSTLSLTSNTQTDTTTFEGVLEQAKNAWMLEYGGNVNKLPVIIHTDQHGWLANGQTIGDVFDTISGMVNWYDISKVINLGDTANSYDNPDDLTAGSTTLENYLDAMSEVPYSKRIEIFGNHDLAYFVDGVLTFIDSEQSYLQPYFRNIFARKTNNNGYFVVKDDNFNVKYVVISGFEVDKEIGNGNGYIMSGKQIAWMIEELQKADGYDVIILSHVPLWKSATETNPIDGTTSSTSYSVDAAIDMDALYAARKNKTSGSVTDRYGITHDYDFSNCNGELLCSLHGHNHSDGYAYTGDSVLSATFQNFYASPRCLYLVLVDRSNRQLNVWKVDSTPQYQNYQIPLDKPAE